MLPQPVPSLIYSQESHPKTNQLYLHYYHLIVEKRAQHENYAACDKHSAVNRELYISGFRVHK